MGKTTLVMTYREVNGFANGSHGNGRVVVLAINPKDYEGEKQESINLSIGMKTFNLLGQEIDKAYVYLGLLDDSNDIKLKVFQAMINIASAHVKEKSHIYIVGCSCSAGRKKYFAEQAGFSYISCEHQGNYTLGDIVKKILSTLPLEEKPQKKLELQPEFICDLPAEESIFRSNYFSKISAIGKTLFAGRSDGTIFWKRKGKWQLFGLKLNQGVNLMVPDKKSLLVGDGSCCSGATWRLNFNGTYEKILPIDGQEDEGENIRCNVYGFARLGKKILVGGGGCAGQHIYELNGENKWQYIVNDPQKYVHSMASASDGKVYVGQEESFFAYDGKEFVYIGDTIGTPHTIKEFKKNIFVGATNSGPIYPTSHSEGYIYRLKNETYEKVWSGAGGINGFFELNGKLYAFGINHVNCFTILLELDGEIWKKLAEFDQWLTFFSHNGTVYAGGEINDKAAILKLNL